MCNSIATTKEHVPPRSFFPKPKPSNLWTVPSCSKHNNENNLDVEYVRNVISTQHGINAIGEQILEVAKRSWDYSDALFKQTFHDIRATIVKGEEVGAFSIDLGRVKSVINAIVHALSYRDFGRQYIGDWGIFCASLASKKPYPPAERLCSQFMSLKYEPRDVPVPEVFSYSVCHLQDRGFVYGMIFYEGFLVYSFPILKEALQTGA
jgi:hypothetical protein